MPLARELGARDADGIPNGPVDRLGIDDPVGQCMAKDDFCRQGDFEVVRLMEGVAVMPRVAGVEHFEIDPAEEGENADEKGIEKFGFENGSMAQFVHRIDQKGAEGAVQEDHQENHADRPVVYGVERQSGAGHKAGEITQRLQPAQEIALFMEALEVALVEGCPVP